MTMPPPAVGEWKVGNVELRAHLDLGFEHDLGGHPRGPDHLHVIGRGGTSGRSPVFCTGVKMLREEVPSPSWTIDLSGPRGGCPT